ncbi:MAG TPA: hypothetical protein PKI93_01670 [Alphaproteobacteria bacterium]|nr:hypothetical protein [Alphaproteobacteria bacterium]HNS44732.1 hypothetical protein [Alphaproteobacteria bacterium]
MLADLTYQEIIGIVSAVLASATLVLYIFTIFKGQTKPHLFTWLIWSILCSIAFVAQITENAGAGSWSIGSIALFCWIITLTSLKSGENTHTTSDKIILFAALLSIVPWLMIKDPVISVIAVSLINVSAFIPTFRKTYSSPMTENLTSYTVTVIALGLSFFALDNINITTSLYPATIAISDTIFIAFCLWRRHAIKVQ